MVGAVKAVLNLVLLLIIVLPFTHSFHPDDYLNASEGWANDYVYEDAFYMVPVGSLILTCILIQVLRPGTMRKSLKIISLIITGYCFLIAMASTMPIQDMHPQMGILLLGTVLPLLLGWYFVEHTLWQSTNSIDGDSKAQD